MRERERESVCVCVCVILSSIGYHIKVTTYHCELKEILVALNRQHELLRHLVIMNTMQYNTTRTYPVFQTNAAVALIKALE